MGDKQSQQSNKVTREEQTCLKEKTSLHLEKTSFDGATASDAGEEMKGEI